MIHRLASALVLIGLAMPATAVAQSESAQQLRRIFAPPVQTLKKVFNKGDRAEPAQPAASAPAKAPEPPPPVEAAAPAPEADSEAVVANVPDPRPRPAQDDEATGIAETDTEGLPSEAETLAGFVPLSEPVDFDRRFEPVDDPTPEAAPAPVVAEVPAVIAETPAIPPVVPDATVAYAPDDAGVAPPPVIDVPLPKIRSAAAALAAATQLASLPPKGADGPELDCMRSLRMLGLVSVSIDPIRKGQCGIDVPTKVSALDNGAIALTSNAVLSCRAAQSFATFMRDQVEPLARKNLRGSVTGVRVAASYSCRTRNNVPGAKLSEHAHGNAIDISAFEIEGVGWVEVGKGKNASARRFLTDVREAGCGPFTTVLGPGSDGYHKDHFHFDVIRRGKNGTSTYCR